MLCHYFSSFLVGQHTLYVDRRSELVLDDEIIVNGNDILNKTSVSNLGTKTAFDDQSDVRAIV